MYHSIQLCRAREQNITSCCNSNRNHTIPYTIFYVDIVYFMCVYAVCMLCVLRSIIQQKAYTTHSQWARSSPNSRTLSLLPFYFVAFVIENDFHMMCVWCVYYFKIRQANRERKKESVCIHSVSFWSRFSHYNIKMMALGILLISNKTPMLAGLGSVTVQMNETKNTAT